MRPHEGSQSAMKHLSMSVAASVLNRVGGGLLSTLYGGRGHILMFHRVSPPSGQPRLFANAYLEVTPAYLEWTIGYFRSHGYAFLRLGEVPAYLESPSEGRPFVVYTFDDGFRDNLEHALPVFWRNKVPFSVNVTTGFPDHKVMMWWTELERLLLDRDVLEIRVGAEARRFAAANMAQKAEAFRAISRWLKHTADGTLEERITQLLEPFGVDPLREIRRAAMSWSEIREVSSEPLASIGAHTMSHPVLATLDEATAFEEISEGKRRLELELGMPIPHFAYPYGGPGEIGEREITLAGRAGFELAVTTYSSNVQTQHLAHLLCLPRIAVGMSMREATFDLIRHGAIPLVRNRGRRLVTIH